jgi:predicted nucleotidyltransferase
MCKLITKQIDNREIRVADIKSSYIDNIINSAQLCDQINRIVLFGSAIEERCTEESDIDIAVYGSKPENKMLLSKSYKAFVRGIFSYDLFQDYDILYFQEGTEEDLSIQKDIRKGIILYEK